MMVLQAKTTRRETDAKTQALNEATKEETTRLNVEIPVSLHRRVKIQAAKEGSSIIRVVTQALREYLNP